MVWNLLSTTVEDYAAIHGGRRMEVFYVDDGLIGLGEPEFIQGDLNVLIDLFYQILLTANSTKSNMTTCHLGMICLEMSEEAVGWRSTGKGATYQ